MLISESEWRRQESRCGAGAPSEGVSESVAGAGLTSPDSMSLLFNACFTLLTEFETLLVSAVQARGGLCYKIPQSCCFVLFFSICLSLSLPLTFKIDSVRR